LYRFYSTSEHGHTYNEQGLIAAQITKLYKFERERGEEIRNRSPVGGRRSVGKCSHLNLFRKNPPDWSGEIGLTNDVSQVTRAYPSFR